MANSVVNRTVSHLNSHFSFWGGASLKKEIEGFSPKKLTLFVHSALEKISLSQVDNLAKLIPLDLLQKGVELDFPNDPDLIESAREMQAAAIEYFDQTTEPPLTLSDAISWIYSLLITSVESIVTAFGIHDFFKIPENDFEERFKSQKIFMLFSFFSLLTTTLLPLLEIADGTKLLAMVFIAINALSLIYPFIQPAPKSLPLAENWTIPSSHPIGGSFGIKKNTLDEVANLLINQKPGKRYPLLVGQSGVGKTETLKAFADAVAKGKYPELAGKQIFYINTAEFVNSSEVFANGNKSLARIKKKLGSHTKNAILIFDEIHLACQGEHSILADQLKRYLDGGDESFPYLIGVTTEEEFFRDIYGKHAAFARRFKTIPIQNTTEDQTLKILKIAAMLHSLRVPVEEGALKQTVTFGENTPQPLSSLQILSKCFEKITETQTTARQKRIKQLQDAKKNQKTGLFSSLWGRPISAIEEELTTLSEEMKGEKSEKAKLEELCDQLAGGQTKMLRTILKTSFVSGKTLTPQNSQQLTLFLLLHRFLIPDLQKKIKEKGASLGIKTSIDSSLINEVLQEEIIQRNRAKEAVQRGERQTLKAASA